MASRRCWMVLMRIRRSNWAGTLLSTCPIWMLRSRGRRAARPRVTARLRCVLCGTCRGRAARRRRSMNPYEGDEQARSTAEAVARRSYGKLVAFLAARTRDVASAEDALSEAFAAALADWPVNGCSANSEAWLLTVARRKTIDVLRRSRIGEMAAAP